MLVENINFIIKRWKVEISYRKKSSDEI